MLILEGAGVGSSLSLDDSLLDNDGEKAFEFDSLSSLLRTLLLEFYIC